MYTRLNACTRASRFPLGLVRSPEKRDVATVRPGRDSRCQVVESRRAGGIARCCLPVEAGALSLSLSLSLSLAAAAAADARTALHNWPTSPRRVRANSRAPTSVVGRYF